MDDLKHTLLYKLKFLACNKKGPSDYHSVFLFTKITNLAFFNKHNTSQNMGSWEAKGRILHT